MARCECGPRWYGNKSVKWLLRIVLTNNSNPNDTYAERNNDVESPMKTFARFLHRPRRSGPANRPPSPAWLRSAVGAEQGAVLGAAERSAVAAR